MGRYRKREQLIEWCRLDRELLLGEFRKRYGHSVERPASVLDDVIVEMLGYELLESPLPSGQMALLEFDERRITVNSRMHEFVHPRTDMVGLINSTKAHELGHLRLHEQEMNMELDRYSGYLPFPEPGFLPEIRQLITYRDEAKELTPDEARREREANTYAALFLVPEAVLFTLPPARRIRRAVNEGREFSVKYLWTLIYKLANWFGVSPSLMKHRLKSLGMIEESSAGITLSSQLELGVEFS